MNEWINSILSSGQAGVAIFPVFFLLGVIGVFVCTCNFSVIASVAGYTGVLGATGKSKKIIVISLFFLLGVVVAMSIIGYLVGFAGKFISMALGNYWKIGVGIILIFFGVYVLGLFPFKISSMSIGFQNKKSGITGAILFGFVLGGTTSFCSLYCNPIFSIVIATSLVKGSTLWGFFLLFFYALGYGVTLTTAMLGVGLGLGKISRLFSKFATIIKYAGGITLIILGFYFLTTF